eukprot:contig_6943_g1603
MFYFCSECKNMLYPVEDHALRRQTGQRKLTFVCRTCGNKEAMSPETLAKPVYKNVVTHTEKEKMVTTMNVTMDPTLSRTYNVRCTKCDAHEAVYFQCPSGRSDSALVLQYVCVMCQHTWLSSDQE